MQGLGEGHRRGSGVFGDQLLAQLAADTQLHLQAQAAIGAGRRRQLQLDLAIIALAGLQKLPARGTYQAMRRYIGALALATEPRPAHRDATADGRGQLGARGRKPQQIGLPIGNERQQLAAEHTDDRRGVGGSHLPGLQAVIQAGADVRIRLHAMTLLEDRGDDVAVNVPPARLLPSGCDGGRLFLQRAQDALACAAIHLAPAQALLFYLDRAARGGTDHAVGGTDIVAAGQQQGLQLAALIAAQARVIGRPGGGQPVATTQLVSQRRDRQRIASAAL